MMSELALLEVRGETELERLRRQFAEVCRENLALRLKAAMALEVAMEDRVTGVPNRTHIERVLADELARSRRNLRPLSLLFVDLDHFKRVNDTLGHNEGDRVLRRAASAIRKSIREVDSLGRWGGEEFVVLLPETPLEGALVAAERVMASVRPTGVTCSIGAAVWPDHGLDAEGLVGMADAALYQAKNRGRDRVCLAG